MFEQIKRAIAKLGNFSDRELDLFTDMLKQKSLQQNEFLLQRGEVCKALYYLDAGSLRQYYKTNTDKEDTQNLFVENDWVLDYQSFISQKPSQNYIRAFRNSRLFELDIYSLHDLIDQNPSFFTIGRLFENGLHRERMNRKLNTAKERYIHIIQNRPLIPQTFPLKHIASYLGITPETLSRIRSQIRQ